MKFSIQMRSTVQAKNINVRMFKSLPMRSPVLLSRSVMIAKCAAAFKRANGLRNPERVSALDTDLDSPLGMNQILTNQKLAILHIN